MSFSIKYKEFYRVNIFHRYFLNAGLDLFESMSPANRKKQLDAYDHRILFDIIPSPETLSELNGHKLIFNKDSKGVSVWGQVSESIPLKPFIEPDDSLSFTFLIRMKDPRFLNYSNLSYNNALQLYYFSNKRSEAEPVTFPLVGLSGSSDFVDDQYILSSFQSEAELSRIPANLSKNIFGIIRIFIKGENSTHHIIDNQGEIPVTPKEFEISFDNRKTFWRYLFQSDQVVGPEDSVTIENGDARILITRDLMPLTSRGFVPVLKDGVELPNAGVASIAPDIANNKIFSEIFM
jgi:hypothetical protein